MLIVAVSGLARSGKDTFARYLKEKYKFEHYDFFRDVIVPLMKKEKINVNKTNAALFGDRMRQKFGPAVFGRKIVEIIKKKNPKRVVVTGLRTPAELVELKNLGKTVFIVIESNLEKRFERRNEFDPKTLEEFKKRDELDIKNKGLGELLEKADYKIENNGTLDEFYAKIDKFVKTFLFYS